MTTINWTCSDLICTTARQGHRLRCTVGSASEVSRPIPQQIGLLSADWREPQCAHRTGASLPSLSAAPRGVLRAAQSLREHAPPPRQAHLVHLHLSERLFKYHGASALDKHLCAALRASPTRSRAGEPPASEDEAQYGGRRRARRILRAPDTSLTGSLPFRKTSAGRVTALADRKRMS